MCVCVYVCSDLPYILYVCYTLAYICYTYTYMSYTYRYTYDTCTCVRVYDHHTATYSSTCSRGHVTSSNILCHIITHTVTSSHIRCHIIIHTMSHHHTNYVTSSHIQPHIPRHAVGASGVCLAAP